MTKGLREALLELYQAEATEKDVMSPESLVERKMESPFLEHVPEGVTIHCAISSGNLLVTSIGVLEVKSNPITLKVKGSQMISFRDIRSVRISSAGKVSGREMFSVTIDRDDPGASNFGMKRAPFVMGMTSSKAHAQNFQTKISELMNGSPVVNVTTQASESALDKLTKLKSLLDLGAITQEEFDTQKSKLMNEI